MTRAEPISLRVSATESCRLRCRYCSPGVSRVDAASGPMPNQDVAACAGFLLRRYGLSKVHLTGGEPLLRPDIVDLVACLADVGLPDLALTTNGQELTDRAAQLVRHGLRRVNVSLDSLDASTFSRITGGGVLARTLRGVDAALAAGLRPVKLNTVVVRGMNDAEVPALAEYAIGRQCEVRFIELMPSGITDGEFARSYVSAEEILARLLDRFGVESLPVASTASSRTYRVRGGAGSATVGIIAPGSRPFCEGCRRLRLASDGDLIGCLARGERVSIRRFFRRGNVLHAEELARIVEEALATKRHGDPFDSAIPMSTVGG